MSRKKPVILSEFGFELIRQILCFLLMSVVILAIMVGYLFFKQFKGGEK